MQRIDSLISKLFLDRMKGGAWPFLVGGVICLVNSDNERDLIPVVTLTDIIYLLSSTGTSYTRM